MMKTGDLVDYFLAGDLGVSYFNGSLDKNINCIGVYNRGAAPNPQAVGQSSSYAYFPVQLIVHWGEDADVCEAKAQELYAKVSSISDVVIGDHRVIGTFISDPHPVDLGRDDNNVCERSIQFQILYNKEV